MTTITEFHVAITSDEPDFESIYAVFSTADKAEQFVIENLPYTHAGNAVITPQTYTETFEYDKREEMAWDTRYDDYADTDSDD